MSASLHEARALVGEMELVRDEARREERQACVRAVCERCRAGDAPERTVARGWGHRIGGIPGLYGATVPCAAGALHELGRAS